VKKSLALLVAGTTGFWLLLAYPAHLLGGESALLFSAVAGLLCLVPAAATLAWCHRAFQGAPEQQLLAVMGGTGVRLVFAIGVAMTLYLSLAEFHHAAFWLWVVVFYLFTLALEIALVAARNSAAGRSSSG
jgi:hypothetical protein